MVSDCLTYFGKDSNEPISRDDSVICSTEYSKIVPLEGGEIPISLLNNRPNATNYFNSSILQEWTRATNVRFRFLRTKNLLACNCDVFYSTGNCEEGSGRCECRKEFTPPNCDSCSFGYYDFPDCKPCDCFLNGTYGLQCEANDGQCPCKVNFGGKFCKECSANYYNFPECKDCECNPSGSISTACDQQYGNCTCRSNYGGEKCDRCQHGYYNYPQCEYCNCDVKGTKEGVCDKETGQCWCKEGYSGARCDQCMQGFYGYPDCRPCNCSSVGATTTVCDVNGKCPCLRNFAGRTCNQCSPGYYKFPECLACLCDTYGSNGISCNKANPPFSLQPVCATPCLCDTYGSNGISCNNDGNCECHHNFDGPRCEKCKEGFYNFPSCEDCNCHPAGVVEGFAGCGSVPAGELCQCKERVEGRICNKCKPLYWNLSVKNPEGCEDCGCNPAGVLGGVLICDSERGQCPCKPSVVARGCTECEDGTYNLQKENLFGCTDCGCDVGGSLSSYCDKTSGQCYCQARVTGRTCTEPLKAHYFPTLYQYQYEIEDGRTPYNSAVRYFYDENDFPDYSWRAFRKPSVYLVVLRYVNKNPEPVVGTITITPDVPSDLQQQQRVQVNFKNSSVPTSVLTDSLVMMPSDLQQQQRVQVNFKNSSVPTSVLTDSLVMNPGRWTFSVKSPGDLLIDYFVLLPEEFYFSCQIWEISRSICFATGCEVSYDGNEIGCDCVDGYGGSRCQHCASGYYGKPEVPEDYCRPCQCNGNIDPSMPDACDRISGDCLNCLNNTYGTG
ncbi:Laminin N-terminal (Domain VI), partial [Popillia japonica]